MSINLVLIAWAVLSIASGVIELVGAYNIRGMLDRRGFLSLFMWSLINGLADVVVFVLIILRLLRGDGAQVFDLAITFILFYAASRVSNIGLAMFITGIASDQWLRDLLRSIGAAFTKASKDEK